MGGGGREVVTFAALFMLIRCRANDKRRSTRLLRRTGGIHRRRSAMTRHLLQMSMIVRRQTPGKAVDCGMSGEEVEDEKE